MSGLMRPSGAAAALALNLCQALYVDVANSNDPVGIGRCIDCILIGSIIAICRDNNCTGIKGVVASG